MLQKWKSWPKSIKTNFIQCFKHNVDDNFLVLIHSYTTNHNEQICREVFINIKCALKIAQTTAFIQARDVYWLRQKSFSLKKLLDILHLI
jgi:hypothetical protein